MKRDIIKIDEDLCNGCGDCVPNCHEGALQVIDGKVRLVSELMCDGLGACIGHCPTGAITIEKREAEPYDETAVIKDMIPKGINVINAHLKHLAEHKQDAFLKEALDYLTAHKEELPFEIKDLVGRIEQQDPPKMPGHGCGCPGAKTISFDNDIDGLSVDEGQTVSVKSELRQWPLQLHLVNPLAPYYQNADVLISADCVAYAMGNYHSTMLKGRSIAIACPKLDSDMEIYVEKIKMMIDDAKVNTITVAVMEVPCCGGLLHMVQEAVGKAQRKVPVKCMVIGLRGEVISEEWTS